MTKLLPDDPISLYASKVIQKHLTAFDKQIPGVLESKDIEYIHRMRVATRRLRNALEIFAIALPRKKSKRWEQDIRKITRALSKARDLDVQIDLLLKVDRQAVEKQLHPGMRRLKLRLQQKRNKLQAEVNQAIEQVNKDHLVEEMTEFFNAAPDLPEETVFEDGALFYLAGKQIEARLKDFLSFEPFITQPDAVEELHAMRIAAKNFRYTLEAFAGLYADQLEDSIRAVRKTQDLLGEIHDCDVWISFLPKFLQRERTRMVDYTGTDQGMRLLKPGLAYFLENRLYTRQDLYARFNQEWLEWKEVKIFTSLPDYLESFFPHHMDPLPLEPDLASEE